MGKKRKRKIIYIVGIIPMLILVLILTLPLWFPWVLKPILQKQGAQFSAYERVGYSRFVLRDLKLTKPKFEMEAQRAEIVLPTTLLWRHVTDGAADNDAQLSNWKLTVHAARPEAKTNNVSLVEIVQKAESPLAQLSKWLHRAELDNGAIFYGERKIVLPKAIWNEGQLSGEISAEKLLPPTSFVAVLKPRSPKKIALSVPTWNLQTDLAMLQANHSIQLIGDAMWQSNRFDLKADFVGENLLPTSASVVAREVRLPAAMMRIEGYEALSGSLNLDWKTNRFTIDLSAHAEPLNNNEIFLSPVDLAVRAQGDTNVIQIGTARIISPWLQASLSDDVEFNFRGEMLSSNATLEIEADLSRQKWIAASGKLKGYAELTRSENKYPNVSFAVSGQNLKADKIDTDTVAVQGEMRWPWVQIRSAKIQFSEGGTAEAVFRFNAVKRLFADGHAKVSGAIGRKFLPPNISYRNAALNVDFSGPIKGITHSGHVNLSDLKLPKLSSLAVEADWLGEMSNLTSLKAKISAKDSKLKFSGKINLQTNLLEAKVETLSFSQKMQPILQLEKPMSLSASGLGKTNLSPHVKMETAHWTGEDTEFSMGGEVFWPKRGDVSISARHLDFNLLNDFLEKVPPSGIIEKLDVAAHWTNAPVYFFVDTSARFSLDTNTLFVADLRADGNAAGISIQQAQVGRGAEIVLRGEGFLPVTFEPARASNLVQVLPKQEIAFHAETLPDATFWEQISDWSHTAFVEPMVALDISGTLSAPQGKMHASVKEITLKSKLTGQRLPRLQNFTADFDLASDRIALNQFQILVEGQPIVAQGELPLPKTFREGWKKIFDWRKINGNLKITDAQIAPFERLFPQFLSPVGTVNLNVIASKGKLSGELKISGAALRPIPSVGPIHDIEARVVLDGEQVKLEKFRGIIGGEPLDLSGDLDLGKIDSATKLPRFNFAVFGTNVALARKADFILRTDIDIKVSNQKGGQPLISGALNLRDSFYLSDPKRLLPVGTTRVRQRPPYFNVEIEPFASWRLNVTARGQNFFRIRSPIFKGELSANFNLGGTLREPILLGDADIESGTVQFPFADLKVTQGFVVLSSENPHRPQLSLSAGARTFSYDLKMNLSGFADAPTVEFSSNPGLTSEQILLMITAGQLPRDEIIFSTQQKVGQLAFFLGKNLFSKFGSSGATEDKLEITSGEDVSTQGRQTYLIEYKLNDEWSLVGEYDRFGAVNAGVKWKFFQK